MTTTSAPAPLVEPDGTDEPRPLVRGSVKRLLGWMELPTEEGLDMILKELARRDQTTLERLPSRTRGGKSRPAHERARSKAGRAHP